jgi:hypothetical protein
MTQESAIYAFGGSVMSSSKGHRDPTRSWKGQLDCQASAFLRFGGLFHSRHFERFSQLSGVSLAIDSIPGQPITKMWSAMLGRPCVWESCVPIRYCSSIAPPSQVRRLSSVIVVMGPGDRLPCPRSQGARYTLRAGHGGQRIKLTLSTNPARRKARLAPPPPFSSSRFTSSASEDVQLSTRSSSAFPAEMQKTPCARRHPFWQGTCYSPVSCRDSGV